MGAMHKLDLSGCVVLTDVSGGCVTLHAPNLMHCIEVRDVSAHCGTARRCASSGSGADAESRARHCCPRFQVKVGAPRAEVKVEASVRLWP